MSMYVVDVDWGDDWVAITAVYWAWLARSYVAAASRFPGQRHMQFRIRIVDLDPAC